MKAQVSDLGLRRWVGSPGQAVFFRSFDRFASTGGVMSCARAAARAACREDVLVGLDRERHGGVAEPFAHDLDRFGGRVGAAGRI